MENKYDEISNSSSREDFDSRSIETRSSSSPRFSTSLIQRLVSEHVDNARKENCRSGRGKKEGVLLYTSIVTVWIYRRDQAEHVHPPAPLSEGILAVNQIPDLRPVHVYINSATSRLSGREKRSWSRSLLFRWIRANDTDAMHPGRIGGGNILVILLPPLYPPPSYRIHFRLFQLRRAFFALLPRGWCFRGSATDKIFRVEAGYSRAVFPDVRIFLARISLERNSREGRGRESPSVKIFEERKFLLGIFTDLCKSLATF